jgi:hypothetical protein
MLGSAEPIVADELERSVEEITAALKEPRQIQERLEQARREIKLGAQRLEGEVAALNLGYVSDFDFSDDPVLLRVRRELGLST